VADDTLYTLHFMENQIVMAEVKDDLSYTARKLQEAYEQRD
jgi:hypothetical protein